MMSTPSTRPPNEAETAIGNFLHEIVGSAEVRETAPPADSSDADVSAKTREARELVTALEAEISRVGTVKDQWHAQLDAYGITPQTAVRIIDAALLQGLAYTRTYNKGTALEVTFAMRPSVCQQRWTTLLANNPEVLTNQLTLNYAQARFYLLESIVRFQGAAYDPGKPQQISEKLDRLPEYAFRRLQDQLAQFDRICELLFAMPENGLGN
jgi:hypothetical protein